MCEDLSSFELDQIDRVEAKYHEISKKNSEKLFEEKFKEVALAITQLYTSVGNHRGPEAYSAFNYAACKLTEFYNEIKDARTNDHKCGYTCKERELLKWTKTRKKHIRREDLIANITGSSPPSRTQYSRSRGSPQRRSPRPSSSIRPPKTFRSDVSHLQETMGNFSMGSPPRNRNSDRKRNFQIFDAAVNDPNFSSSQGHSHKRMKFS